MSQSENVRPPVELYKKILAAQKAIKSIVKDKESDAGSYRFDYASAMSVNQQTRDILHELGLIVITSMKSERTELTRSSKTNEKTGVIDEKTNVLAVVEIEYTIIDTETGQSISVTYFGHGTDTGDKAIYKAITGTGKYARLGIFDAATSDDPENTDKRKKSSGGSSSSGASGKAYPSKYGSADDPKYCRACGKKHIVKGMMVVKSGDKWIAQECVGKTPTPADPPAKEQPKADTKQDEPPLPANIAKMTREAVIIKVEAGEAVICNDIASDVEAMRTERFGVTNLDVVQLPELKQYLAWIATVVKANK